MFYHSITEFVFLMNIFGKRSDLPFSCKSDCKKEKSTVSFTHVQNIICSQTQLDGIAQEQTIICRLLFAGHLVGSRPMKRKKNLLRMIIVFVLSRLSGFQIICTEIDEKEKKRVLEYYSRISEAQVWCSPSCLSFVNLFVLMTTSCIVFVWHIFPKTTRSVSELNKVDSY